MERNDLSPSDLTIASGTRVRWVNGSSTTHTVTPDGQRSDDATTR
jgi:plastocyanin